MRKRSKLNKAVCIILMLLLIVEILATFMVGLLKNTILSKEYIKNELEKTGYYQTTKSEIEDAFKYYVLQSNLDDECVTDLITVDKVKKDTLLCLDQGFSNGNEEIDVSDIKEELNNRIKNKVVNDYNHLMSTSEEKDISTVVNVIVDNYSNNMQTAKTVFSAIGNIARKLSFIKEQFIIIGIIAIIITAVLISIIYIKGSKNKKMIINKYQAIALMTVGMVILIPLVILSFKINIGQIQLFTKGLTKLLVDSLTGIKNTILAFGIITLIAGIGIAIAKNIMMKKYLR